MNHGTVPRTLHVGQPSSHVDWSAGLVEPVTDQVQWPAVGRPRRAGVSSFGFSGTNAHVILEQVPDHAQEPPPGPDDLVTPWAISAKSRGALRDQAARLCSYVAAHPELAPGDIGLALATTRTSFDQRAVVLGVHDLQR